MCVCDWGIFQGLFLLLLLFLQAKDVTASGVLCLTTQEELSVMSFHKRRILLNFDVHLRINLSFNKLLMTCVLSNTKGFTDG